MLTRLNLEKWKSFGPKRRPLTLSPLTVLVGPNASGKSNVFDALRFLQGLALGYSVDDVLRGRSEGGRETWSGIRGGPQEAARSGKTFRITTEWSEGWSHELAVDTGPLASVAMDVFSDVNGEVFSTHAASLKGNVERNPAGGLNVAVRGAGTGNRPSVLVRDLMSVVSQLEPDARFAPEVLPTVQAYVRAVRSLFFLDIQPRLMRAPSPLGRSLGLSGEHIAAAVHELSVERRRDVVDWLAELCAPRVKALVPELIEKVQEVFLFLEEDDGTRVSARSLSDGTLRFLGTLVALMTTPEGSTVLLEEPDVGLHPARVHLLAEFLEQITAERRIQVLATSHSPTLLAHLSERAFLDVLAFDRDDEDGSTIVHQIRELKNFEKLLSPEKRASLISTGWLERAS